MNLAAIWHVFRLSLKILWIAPDEIPNMLAISLTVILLFLTTSHFTQFPFSSLLLTDACHQCSVSSFNSCHSFEIGKLFTHLDSSHCLLSKSYFKITKLSAAFSTSSEKIQWTCMVVWEACHFLGIPQPQMEQHTLVHNKTLLNNYTCCSLIWSGKWLSRCFSINT